MHIRRKISRVLYIVFVFAAALAFAIHASSVSLKYDDVMYTSSEPLILEDGTTYVSARALLDMRDTFTASWNGGARTASFSTNGLELSVAVDDTYIIANNRSIDTGSAVKLIGGRVYVPVRALAKALGAEVDYDGKTSTVMLTTVENYIDKSSSYSEDDLYWLARIINAESCDEPYAGKIMVGNVVLNRKSSTQFPNTVYGVIFDRTNAVQFTPTANGTIYNTPCEECIAAAKAVLMGANRAGKALYFVNTSIVPNSWVSNNRPVMTKVGNHTFYL